ncbi:MAG: hypothetical protein FWD69_14165 [Polyangiaceae bacterium]|nr:hypothetical protein [Polyangiaceae bacterium]
MRISVFFPTLAMLLVVGLPASAQQLQQKSMDPRKDEAEVLVAEGNHLHDRKLETESLAKYKEAYALYPSPNVLFNVAFQEQVLGQRLEALRHFREALRNPLIAPRGMELGKGYIAELEPSFARVDFKGPSGLVVSLGKDTVKLPLAEPLDIEPGTVTATGEMDGQRYQGSAKAGAGEFVTIEMEAAMVQPVVVPPAEDKKEDYWTGRHITGVALGGAAVVAAGLGIGFLAAHNGHAADANSFALDPYACQPHTNSACQNYQSAKDSAKNAKTGEIVSFVAAGALAVGAVVLLWPTPKKEGARVTARVIPTGQGVLIDGAF